MKGKTKKAAARRNRAARAVAKTKRLPVQKVPVLIKRSDAERRDAHAAKLDQALAKQHADEVDGELSVKKFNKKLTAKERKKLNAKLAAPPNHDVVALASGKPVARTVADSTRPTAPVDPAHPMFVDAHMNVFIHVREGRGADYFLTLDAGTYKVKRIVVDDPARKHWKQYVGPSTRAAAAAIYERSFLPKTAEAARVICELQGKSITDLDTATRKRLLSGDGLSTPEEPLKQGGTTVAKKAKATKTTKKVSTSNGGFNPEAKITLLVKENPKREGTAAHKIFKLYQSGMLVKTFFEKGGTPVALRWDQQHKFVSVK